jgi:hypothetical protein
MHDLRSHCRVQKTMKSHDSGQFQSENYLESQLLTKEERTLTQTGAVMSQNVQCLWEV